jgi:amidase
MSEICFQSATALAQGLRRREIGSRELLEQFIKRVERFNSELNAVVTLDLERARTSADAADAEAKRGASRGPLHGLPITVKDTFETAGLRTTGGIKNYSQHLPTNNATAVQRLIDAGAIVFGKTNTPAFAADIQTYNEIFGTTNNPWDRARTPGGSSGGSAVAVATGFTAFELGSDIGGSIRIPVHCCGVYGHKTTYGIIPSFGQLPSPPGSLSKRDISVAGPIARTAEDLDLVLGVVAGPPSGEAVGWKLALPLARHKQLRDYRIAVWLDDPEFPVDTAVRDALQRAIDALRRAGATIDEGARPGFNLRDAFRAFLQLLYPVTTAGLPDKAFEKLREIAAQSAADDDSARPRLARFATITHREWMRINELRERYRASWRTLFEQYDVLLTPASPVPAIPHDQNPDMLARTITVNGKPQWYWDQQVWISLAGMAYLPATVAPIGLAGSLPVGIQIIGPYLEDRTTIDFAQRLASVVGGFQPPPGYI